MIPLAMAQQASPQKSRGKFGQTLRVTLYLLAFVVMTVFPSIQTLKILVTERKWNYSPLAYEVAENIVKKRNEATQRKILAPFQSPSQSEKASSPQDGQAAPDLTVYNLSLLWDRTGRKPIIVSIDNPTIWRYFVVEISVALQSAGVQHEIESPENAFQIQEMITDTISAQKVEEVRLPEGKAKLKAEIRNRMNAILGENKIVEVYFNEFFYQ